VTVEAGLVSAGTAVTELVAVEISFVESDAEDTSAAGAAVGVVATGVSTPGAGASVGAAAAGTASVEAAAGVAGGTEAAAVTLVVEEVGCAAAVELVSVGGWACGWSSSYIFNSNAARAAAWSGVSVSARAEINPAPNTTNKAKKILFFINLSIFSRPCEHVRGQFAWLMTADRHFDSGNRFLGMPEEDGKSHGQRKFAV
jgi:hypothetical protein